MLSSLAGLALQASLFGFLNNLTFSAVALLRRSEKCCVAELRKPGRDRVPMFRGEGNTCFLFRSGFSNLPTNKSVFPPNSHDRSY